MMKTVRIAAVAVLGALWSGWVQAEPLTLLETGSVLRFVDTSAPSVSLGTVAVSGLQPGEAITAIDYRPANGALYGVGVVEGGVSRLYTINTATGAASLIGGGPFDPRIGLSPAAGLGMDFDPVADLIRLVNNIGSNMRVHPDTATATDDTETNFAAGDPNQNNSNSPNSIAYSNNVPDAGSTTLYGVVSGNGPQFVRIGSPGGTPVSPNSGQMFTVGATGTFGFSVFHQGLDVSRSGAAYMIVDNDNRLYTVNLSTGAVTALGFLPLSTTQGPMDLAARGANPRRRSARK
jgi:hypothetical protein